MLSTEGPGSGQIEDFKDLPRMREKLVEAHACRTSFWYFAILLIILIIGCLKEWHTEARFTSFGTRIVPCSFGAGDCSLHYLRNGGAESD